MPLPGGYLLDTNVIVELVRWNPLGQYLDATYGLLAGTTSCSVSVITHGELNALMRKFNWGSRNIAFMQACLSALTLLDINDPQLLTAYGEIDAACDAGGRPMGKNDVWIAATARVTATTVLTSDRDFDFIHGTWIDREWVDPASKLTP
jgi:predicted nucleic acid-binding protein